MCKTPILLLFFMVSPSFAGTTHDDHIINTADGLYDAGFWDGAITEYRRFLFCNPGDSLSSDCLQGIARCYFALGQHQSALEAAAAAVGSATDAGMGQQRRLELGRIYLKMGRLSSAELEFMRVYMFSRNRTIRRRAARGIVACRLRTLRWKDARTFIEGEESGWSAAEIHDMNAMFASLEDMPVKSPELARWLSTVLPGAGQAYCGNALAALHSSVLNAAMGYVVFRTIRNGDIAGALIGVPFLIRYYLGGRRNAAAIAADKNRRMYEDRAVGLAGQPDPLAFDD